ncbi:hypothetical protein [Vibrio sp. D431a]|uniref:hypothetical protein n=1 Tax=Vibrio sp. D431a TaxID=2837388 RepID=UPI0025549417|nr:hypothetical protein [Vibrio sp. D431a]MDK9793865.1 hypothetical protein [Vibrio sp. D431a]
MPTFIKKALLVLLLVMSNSSWASGFSSGSVDNPCDNIFVDGGVSDTFSPRVICNQDLMATSLNMLFSDSYYKSTSIQAAYNQAGLPSPDITGGQFDNLSGMVSSMSAAMIQIFLFVAIPFFGVALTVKAVDAMKQEEWSSAMKKPEVWGSGIYFMSMVMLATVVDGYMIGQTIVVISAGVALGFANQLMTALLPSFTFSTAVTESSSGIEPFIQEGRTYAERLVTGLQGARDSAVFLASAATPPIDDEIEYLKGSSFNVKYTEEGWFNKHYDSRDISVADYARHMLTSKAITVKKTPIFNQGLSIAGEKIIKPSGTVQYTLSSGRAVNGKLYKEFIENDIHASDVFEDKVVYTSSFGVPPVSSSSAMSLAANKFGSDTIGRLFNLSSISSKDVQAASDPIITYVKSKSFDEDANLIAQTIPYLMLGVYDESKVASGNEDSAESSYNPREVDAIPSSFNKVETAILNAGINATHKFTSAACATGLKDASTAGRVLSDALFAKALDSGASEPISSLDDFANQSNLQCFVFENGRPKFLLAPLFASMPADVLNIEIPESERIKMIKDSVDKINEFASKEAKVGRGYVDQIANYYASVKAISGYVALEQVNATEGDETAEVLTNLRKQGVGALHAYFFQIASIMKIYREQYLSASSIVIDHSVALDNALLTNRLKSEEEQSALDRFLGSSLLELQEKGSMSFVPVGSTTSKSLIGDDSSLVTFDGNMEDSKFSDIANRVMEGFVDSALVPLTILKDGFGFDEDKTMRENYKDCSTITNCIEINGHPLVVMSEFGKDMFYNSMFILILDYIIQDLLINAVLGKVEKLENFMTATLGSKGGWLTSVGLKVLGIELLVVILKVIAAISGIFATFAKVLIVAGMLLGFVLPVLPLLTGLFLWAGWLFEVLILFLIFPIIAFLGLLRVEGKPIITFGTLVSMMASIVIKPLLFVVSFMGLFSLSYVMFYLVNSVMYHMYNQIAVEGGNFILTFAANQLSLALVVFIYFKILVKVNNEMAQIPEHVCNYIGVKSFNGVAATGVEQLIAASAISGAVKSALPEGNLNSAVMNRKNAENQELMQQSNAESLANRYADNNQEVANEKSDVAGETLQGSKGTTL